MGEPKDCFVATAINKQIAHLAPTSKVYWVVKDNACKSIFRYNKYINRVFTKETLKASRNKFDVLLNLHPDFIASDVPQGTTPTGVNFSPEAEHLSDVLFGNKKSNLNAFQLYFKMAGMNWRGESYDLKYYPSTRSKKNRTGLAVAHAKLRRYVNDNLDIDKKRAWIIPFKNNLFKQMDEINRCAQVVTDDLLTMHMAVYLRKQVHYISAVDINVKPEFFGKGKFYKVPENLIR